MASADSSTGRLLGWLPGGAPRAGFILALVVAAALRAAALDKPFYIDEIVTMTVASQPLDSMARVMRLIDASPALYPLVLHFWIEAGRADIWVRLLPALCGFLAVPVTAHLTFRTFGWPAALATAWIMAIAPAHVHYAQYVRSYSLFTLLAAVHLWLFVDVILDRRPMGRRRGAALVAVTTALLYTHYLSLLLMAAEGVVALVYFRRGPRQVLAWAALLAAAGVLFLPGVPLLLHNATFDRIRNLDRPERPPAVRLVPNLVAELSVGQRALGFSDPVTRRATLSLAAVVFPALATLGIVHGWRRRPEAVVLFLALAVVPLVIFLVSGRRLIAVRFFLPFMVGYLALLGCGLASLGRRYRHLAAGALVVVCAVPLWHFYTRFSWSYDHSRVARAIAQASHPDDVLVVVHPYEAFYYSWYLDGRLPIRGVVFTPLVEQDTYVIKPPPLTLERARDRIRDVGARHERFWLIGQSMRSFASDAAEEARLLAWLDETHDRVADLGELTGNDPIVRLYAVRGESGSVR